MTHPVRGLSEKQTCPMWTKCSQTLWILSVWVSTHAVQIASRMLNGRTNMPPVNTELPVHKYTSCKVWGVFHFVHAARRTNIKIHKEFHFLNAARHTNIKIHEELKWVYGAACMTLAMVSRWVAYFKMNVSLKYEISKFVRSLSPEVYDIGLDSLVNRYSKCLSNGEIYVEK